MNDVIQILIAGLIVFFVGLPFVKAYSKGKKEMEAADESEES